MFSSFLNSFQKGCKSIGDKEGNELLKVLSFNLCLVECNLNGTSISNQIQDEIKSKLRKNFPLTQTLGKTSINRICLKYFDIAELVILNKMDEVNDLFRKNNFTIRDFQDILFIFCAFNQFELCEKILTEYTLDMNVKLEVNYPFLKSILIDFKKLFSRTEIPIFILVL